MKFTYRGSGQNMNNKSSNEIPKPKQTKKENLKETEAMQRKRKDGSFYLLRTRWGKKEKGRKEN